MCSMNRTSRIEVASASSAPGMRDVAASESRSTWARMVNRRSAITRTAPTMSSQTFLWPRVVRIRLSARLAAVS